MCNGSNEEFAKIVGENQNTTSNWMKRNVKLNVVVKILKAFPVVSVDWLILGEGNMLKPQFDEAEVVEDVDYRERYYKTLEEKDKISTQLIDALKKIDSLKDELYGENGKKGMGTAEGA